MAKTVAGLFGGGSGKARRLETAAKNKADGERLAEQSRILNERNASVEKEAGTATRSRRGRRLLAYRGQETGLSATLGG